MAVKKSRPVTYKRDKTGRKSAEIPADVKWLIWVDLIGAKFLWVALAVVLLYTIPKVSVIPVIWQWIKRISPTSPLFLHRLTLHPRLFNILLQHQQFPSLYLQKIRDLK